MTLRLVIILRYLALTIILLGCVLPESAALGESGRSRNSCDEEDDEDDEEDGPEGDFCGNYWYWLWKQAGNIDWFDLWSRKFHSNSTVAELEARLHNGTLELSTGAASYISSTGYSATGKWSFTLPSLAKTGTGEGSGVSYTMECSANVSRTFTFVSGSGPFVYKGQQDARDTTLVSKDPSFPGVIRVYHRGGGVIEFDNEEEPVSPADTFREKGPLRLLSGEGRKLVFHYDSNFNSSGYPRAVAAYANTGSASNYTRLWNYETWTTAGSTTGPSVIKEYASKQAISNPFSGLGSIDTNLWSLARTITFTYFQNQSGYADATLGDLIAIDVETNLSTSTETSVARTFFKYHTGTSLGLAGQIRAVIGSESYRDFVITEYSGSESEAKTAIFKACLDCLRGQPSYCNPATDCDATKSGNQVYSKNYLDREYEYYPLAYTDPSVRGLLRKRAVWKGSGSCGCSGGTDAGGTFWYSYAFNGGSPTLDQWKTQVTVRKGSSESSPVFAYFEYNDYGRKIVQALVDPQDSTRRQVRRWSFDTSSGYLTTEYYPSACASYNESTHAVGYDDYDGLVYTYSYVYPNAPTNWNDAYKSAKYFKKGNLGSPVQLWGKVAQKYTSGYRQRYYATSVTVYQPSAVTTYYAASEFHSSDPIAVKRETITLPLISSAENGGATNGYVYRYFDLMKREIWRKDAAGATFYTQYEDFITGNGATRSRRTQYSDVNTSVISPPHTDFTNTFYSSYPTPVPSPLHVSSSQEFDAAGRLIKDTDPNGVTHRVYYTRLYRGEDVTLSLPHLPASGGAIGAVNISVSYQGGAVRDQAYGQLLSTITDSNYNTTVWNASYSDLTAAFVGGPSGDNILQRTKIKYESGHKTAEKRFIDPINASETDNVYTTTFSYDENGSLSRVQDPAGDGGGTITAYAYDFLSRLKTVSIGTDDGTPGNMTIVESHYYDGGDPSADDGTGDGKLTLLIYHVDSNSSNDRVTEYTYDYGTEGRLVLTHSPTGIIERLIYNRMGLVTEIKIYAGTESSSYLRHWEKTFYDVRGAAFEVRTIAVNPLSGATNEGGGDYNTVRNWRNQRGDILKIQSNGGNLEKVRYDGIGRVNRRTVSIDATESTYPQAVDLLLGSDSVVTQSESMYDAAGNLLIAKRLDRLHTYTGVGTDGPLPHAQPTKARGNYEAMWYDKENRLTHHANYGNNNDSDLNPPLGGAPTGSDSNRLVTIRELTPLGQLKSRTDPAGLKTSNVYDGFGRLVEKKENSTGTGSWSNRTTEYDYTVTNLTRVISASSTSGGPQVTTFTYGVNPSQEGGYATTITSNRLVYRIDYPAEAGDTDRNTYGYNAQSELTYKKDSAGNQHAYGYTAEGFLASDVATIVTGFDSAVQSLWWTYDGIGRILKATSRTGTTGTSSIANEVQYEYEKYGLVAKIYQNPTGQVNTASTPSVYYGYNYPSAGAIPGLRRTQTGYPSGIFVNELYDAGTIDYYMNRPSGRQITTTSTTLFRNEYLGGRTVTKRKHPTPNVDRIRSLDRFRRTSDLQVVKSGAYNNNYQYSYNNNSQVTVRREYAMTNSTMNESERYNGLSMMDEFKRGPWDTMTGTISNPTLIHSWLASPPGLDHSGNWRNYLVFPPSITPIQQTFNKSNEITVRAGDSTFASYDANGNMLTAWTLQYKYDAWNRLVEVRGYKPTYGTQLLVFKYDAWSQKIRKIQYMDSGKYYYYGLEGQVLEERDGTSGAAKSWYIWGTQYVDELVAKRSLHPYYGTEVIEYYMQDANFNITTRIDSSGNVVNRYVYSAYGKPTQLSANWLTQTAITEDLYLFAGREYHQLVGNYDYRTRHYDPELGRYLTNDKLGKWEDYANFGNAFAYVAADPQNRVDPSGRITVNVIDDWTEIWDEALDPGTLGNTLAGKPNKHTVELFDFFCEGTGNQHGALCTCFPTAVNIKVDLTSRFDVGQIQSNRWYMNGSNDLDDFDSHPGGDWRQIDLESVETHERQHRAQYVAEIQREATRQLQNVQVPCPCKCIGRDKNGKFIYLPVDFVGCMKSVDAQVQRVAKLAINAAIKTVTDKIANHTYPNNELEQEARDAQQKNQSDREAEKQGRR